jgi:hypothetical protein
MAKAYTLVFVNDGVLDYETFSDVEEVRERLLERGETDDKMALFRAEPLPFSISREPTITIGLRRGRPSGPVASTGAIGKPSRKGRTRRGGSNGANAQNVD